MIQLHRPKAQGITLTEGAVRMVQRILEKEGKAGSLLRVGVKGGGCSGFSYHMAYESERRAEDLEFAFHGLRVVVDPRSMEFLNGLTLDYKDGLESGFKWENPNATKSCSCGESSRSTECPIRRSPSERSVSIWRLLLPLLDFRCVITSLLML